MKVYLASRYGRREELCRYRAELEALGHDVTSRWLNGTHQIPDAGTPIGDDGEALIEGDDGLASESTALLREQFALEDVGDLLAADCVVSFTEPPRSTASRGGRHVEFGMAVGINAFACTRGAIHEPFRLVVIGYRENIFHWPQEVEFHKTWVAFLEALASETEAAA